jgi:putative ABC transport system permease protein
MKALDRKLLRDLWTIKTQVVSIALVIACGIGGFLDVDPRVAAAHAARSTTTPRAFPHVFAEARRAPSSWRRIADIPGVVGCRRAWSATCSSTSPGSCSR